jgi:ferredoxin--NADP+ reductase
MQHLVDSHSVNSCIPIDEIRQLKRERYNATIESIVECNAELRVLRIRPDQPGMRYTPGQYTLLGPGAWEPLASGSANLSRGQYRILLKRPYSFSSPIFAPNGEIVEAGTESIFEFYIALAPNSALHPPGLTARLFALRHTDRLFLGRNPKGRYTTRGVAPTETIIFVATGVGEAPHNSMLANLLRRGHRGPIVSLLCTRHRRDQAYAVVHRLLASRYANFRSVALTTREPENLDPSHPQFVGKHYLQDVFSSPTVEQTLGVALDPAHCHVFLCGNSTMVGVPHHDVRGQRIYPRPVGMIEILESKGFRIDEPDRPGNLHFEQFW